MSAKKTKKHKDRRKKKSTSTSSSQSSRGLDESTSSFYDEDCLPKNPTFRPRQGRCNLYLNRWIGKAQKYSGSADGSIDTWFELMEERLDCSSMSARDKILTIKDHLTEEARKFLINNGKRLSRVFKLLSGRFGFSQNQRQDRMEFNSRYQKPKESMDCFIDALNALRVRVFPNKHKETRSGEILQKFVTGVSEKSIHTLLITTYCRSRGHHVPSMEELRKTVKEFVFWKKNQAGGPRWQ